MKAATCALVFAALSSATASDALPFRLVPLPPGLKAVLVPTPAQIKYQGAMSALIHFGQ
jgi:hypothetical protein